VYIGVLPVTKDAGGINIMPSQDAIAEFNMMTSTYSPDYGISSGATMRLSLKSGTQKFHGVMGKHTIKFGFIYNRNHRTSTSASTDFARATTFGWQWIRSKLIFLRSVQREVDSFLCACLSIVCTLGPCKPIELVIQPYSIQRKNR
jgi:hypothetical protein